MESRRNSSVTSSQDSIRCSSAKKSKVYCTDWEKHQKISQEEFYSCRCSMTVSCGTRHNEQECLANARLGSLCARRFGKGQWSFIGPGSEKKWYSTKEDSPQGIWDNLAEKMLLEIAESGCPIFRATTPLSRGQLKRKGHGKLSIHFTAVQETRLRLFLA